MLANASGAPLTPSTAQPDVTINSVDSYRIHLAVTGTSCDKYPGMSPFAPWNQGKLRKVGMPSHTVRAVSRSTLVFAGSRPAIAPTSS